jgi:hypothetical protein
MMTRYQMIKTGKWIDVPTTFYESADEFERRVACIPLLELEFYDDYFGWHSAHFNQGTESHEIVSRIAVIAKKEIERRKQ